MTKRSHAVLFLFMVPLLLFGCDSAPAETVTPDAAGSIPPATQTAQPLSPTATSLSRSETAPTSTLSSASPTSSQTPNPSPIPSATATETIVPTPTLPPAIVEVEGAVLPPGFSFITYAEVARPTALTTDREGRVYATSQDGTVHLLEDEDGDGRADSDTIFAFGFNIPLGITVAPDGETIFVSSNSKISTLRDSDGDRIADEIVNFTSGLPVGRHQNDNLKFGPDGMLYIGVGSTCDVCFENDDRSATIMRFDPVSRTGEVFASGLRNPYDLAFHPFSGELFATDNGRDDLGMDAPGEELNLILQDAHYGWPDCWDLGVGPDCAGTETAVAFFESHSSANSLDFYAENRFPVGYRSDQLNAVAYVGIFGSWLKPGVETGIARVQLIQSGSGYTSEVTWFAQWPGGMPLGLIVGPDGALYVGDYINDRIYRISYGA